MSDDAVDLLDPAVVQDPYPLYARLRRDRPLCPLKGGGYLLTRHADVTAALADPALRNGPSRFSILHASKKERYEAARLAANILPFQDAPAHTANRKRALRALSRRAPIATAALSAQADETLAGLHGRDRFDLIADFGRPFAARAMSLFLGVDISTGADWLAGAEAFFHLFAPIRDPETLARVNADLRDLRVEVRRVMEAQSTDGADGFAAAMDLGADGPIDEFDSEAVADAAILLFADGVENVQFAIATTWTFLHADEALITRLSGDAETPSDLIDEALRLHAPAQSVPRIVSEDRMLHGVALKAETPLFLSIGAANRDEAAFASPDAVDLAAARGAARAMTFGAGRHSCIGGRLATDLIRAGVDALHRHDVQPITPFSALRFLPRFGHRWPESATARFAAG